MALVMPGVLLAQGTISSVTPNSTPAYSPATAVTISGSNFAAQSSVVFTPPNGPATTITPSEIQAAQIAATIPSNLLSTAGTAQIAIQNGSGTLSNQIPFTITSPIATSMTPDSAVAHSRQVAVTIAGSSIVSSAVVSFTGPTGATVTVSPSQVQAAQIAATLPAVLLSTAGTAQIAIQNGPGALSNQLPFTIGPSVSIKPPALKDATVGAAYSDSLSASGGTAPYTWSLFSGALPAGLALDSSGAISGNATTAGPSAFSVQVTDASGAVATASAGITVKAAGLSITTTAFPSGVLNFQYPRQVLNASGGVTPYSFSITSGSLPAGLVLTDGVISGTPTASGTSSFTITATDSAGTTGSAKTSIVIRGAGTDLLLLSGGVSFSLMTGSNGLPGAQIVAVQSTDVTQTLKYSASVSSAPWLSVSSDGATPGTIKLGLTQAALSLTDGTSNATVTLTCTSTACATKTQTIAVSLVVSSPPAQLNVASTPLSFHASSTLSAAQSQSLAIQNAGSGSLDITSITCGAPWCAVGTVPSSVSAGAGTQLTITVDPSKLPTGSDYTKFAWHTSIEIRSAAGSASVPVTLFVSSKPYLSLSQSGDQFSMQPGGVPGNPPGSFLVTAIGGAANWTATADPAADWLTVSTPSGTASDAQPGGVVYSINAKAANLAAGTYYGDIVVNSTNASSTALNFVVILNVTSATQAPTLALSPGALIFVANAGASPSTQKITVYTNSKAPESWQAAATADDTGNWLSIVDKGTTSASIPGESAVTVDATKLTQGIYSGHMNYALGALGIRTVDVKLVVLPASVTLPNGHSAGDSAALQPRDTCSPSSLILAPTGIAGNFAAPAAWPTPIAMTLINDCGKPVAKGQVVVTFSNGDAPLALSLASGASGLYTATWTPHNPTAQLTINARGSAAGFAAVTTPVAGSVVPNEAPVLTPNGTVHPYNPVIGGALAPGTIVAIYGSSMATVPTLPSTTPLPTKVNGTTVLMGGIPAPLFYVSATQINAQIPFDLDPSNEYQIIVNANGALSMPQPLQLSAATPGLDAFPDGTIVALHSATGALVSAGDPARPGEFIVMFLLGMGKTDNPVTTGDTSPTSTLNHPLSTPTLTLAGKPVPVAFAGLTPGLVGLYQINLQIPDVDVDGNLVLTVSQNGDTSNSTILPVLR
jgi:uncharacterized protein (TIGR03437 family)